MLVFSFSGDIIPAENGVLTKLIYEGNAIPCILNLVISGISGNPSEGSVEDCLMIVIF